MGASKRLAEICLQSLDANQDKLKTIFSIVRFGNVLESSGSVIPKFREQIIQGGPVTVTHREITRYFMTLSEASQLVIQAGAMSNGGDVFVLDMGEPVKIYDLASKMIKLSGFTLKNQINNPNGDIEIKIIGLRPGEKLLESLINKTQSGRIIKKGKYIHIKSVIDYKNTIDSSKLKDYNSNINTLTKQKLKKMLIELNLF